MEEYKSKLNGLNSGSKGWYDYYDKSAFKPWGSEIGVDYSSYYTTETTESVSAKQLKEYVDEKVNEILKTFKKDAEELKSKGVLKVEKKKNLKVNGSIITGIYPNEAKRILVVKFSDGETVRLTCHKEDVWDINIGVALAMSYKMCGSKNAYRKQVEELAKPVTSKVKKEEPAKKVTKTRTKKSKKVEDK